MICALAESAPRFAEQSDYSAQGRRGLLDEPNCNGITIELSLPGFNGCHNDKHRVQHPERYQDWNPNQEDAENRGDRIVNQHRDLEIQRFLSVRVDLRRVAAFYQP